MMYRHGKTMGAAVCALAALAVVLLLLRPWSASKPPAVKPVEPVEKYVDVPTTPEAEPAPPAREDTSVPPESVPAPPAASDGPAEEPREAAAVADREEPPYKIRVREVSMSHTTGSDATIDAICRCEIDFGRELPERMALVSSAHVHRGETGRGAPVVSTNRPGSIHTFRSGSRRHRFSVGGIVPADTESIHFLEGTLTKVVAAGTERVSWEDPANQVGEARSAAGFEFVLAGYERDATEAGIEVHFRVPAAGLFDPLHWASSSIILGARCEDGSLVEARGGGSGDGLDGKWGNRESHCKVGERKVEAVQASFVTGITLERLPFRLEDVKLPSAPNVAANGKVRKIGPRGKTTVESEGHVFTLCEAGLDRRRRGGRETGSLTLHLKVRLAQEEAPGQRMVAYATGIADAAALDDRGARHTGVKWASHPCRMDVGGPEKPMMAHFFSLPHHEADRLVTFSGIFRIFCATSTSSASFVLAELPEDIKAPLKRGPVAITAMSHVNDIMKLALEIDKDAYLAGKYSLLGSFEFDLLDDAGKPMGRCSRGGGDSGPGARTYRTHVSFDTGGRVPVMFRARYPVGFSVREIPFEFKDVGLPRKPGKHSYEDEVF
ncbi:MAG: hypothetical protein ACYS9X_14585 [Planctomycetota bacterium]